MSIAAYLMELQEQLAQLAAWAGLHMQEAQLAQKHHYDRLVRTWFL